jgi:indolepyruvate decarboxylase
MTVITERSTRASGNGAGAKGMTMTIGDFLLRRIREAGVEHAFGVPGDLNLEFLQQMEDSGVLKWIGTCNELNASYAADGYARLNGLAALIITNGVGALSAINGVAGSYSEKVPVICVCGSVPIKSLDRGLLMHHTLADGSVNTFMRAFEQVTVACARLTPRNAVEEIDRLIRAAWREKLPVYLELPSDIAFLDIEVPEEPLVLEEPSSDQERLRSCVTAIADRLRNAKAPAILVDLDADRFGVAPEIMELAEKMQLPVAAINTSKAVIEETFPFYVGLYGGEDSNPRVREAIESSDCLLAFGYRRVDTTSGGFTDRLPDGTIHLRGYSVDAGPDNYQAVTLKEVLRAVVDTVSPVTNRATRQPAYATTPDHNGNSAKLTQSACWQNIQGYIRSGDVLIPDGGTCLAGVFGLDLPPNCTVVVSTIWGAIGYSVGSLLGTLAAAPNRRHLLFVGDGSFQMTAQQLSTILWHGFKPVIFLINNGGYTVERCYLGKTARYNDIPNWSYAMLPKVFSADTSARSFVVKTVEDLREALSAPNDTPIFIEAMMDAFDAPSNFVAGTRGYGEVDYGPRGPQHRGNIRI